VHFVEAETLTLYVELTQIPNIMVIYRRPNERTSNAEKLSLEHRGLKSVPLLEGEEKLKQLNLSFNEISKIENIVSLPNLTFLDLSQNKLTEISKLPAF
jgi:Leucine-rich repeat (LRR) protein